MIKSGQSKLMKICSTILAFIVLLIFQEFTGKAGSIVAGFFSYNKLDPDNVFLWQITHHLVILIIGIIAVAVLSRVLKENFGFQLGDRRTGMRFFLIFTAVLAIISLLYHWFMQVTGIPLSYGFELNRRNIVGTLGFQLFLSGSSEEILYMAIPITVLLHILGKSEKKKSSITMDVILASVLFSVAHIKWSLSPFVMEVSISQLGYAFAIGTVQGIAFKESRSVLYPIMMHSISNVLMVGTGYIFYLLA